MADETKTEKAKAPASTPSSDPTPKPDPTPEPEADRYDREVLIEEARGYLGVSSHVAAGALFGDERKTFEIDQAKDLVKKFLKTESADPAEEEEG